MVKSVYNEIIFENHQDLFTIQKKYKLPQFVINSLLDSSEISHLRTYKKKYYLILSFPTNNVLYRPENIKLHPLALIVEKTAITFLHNSSIDLSTFFKTLSEKNSVAILYEFLASTFNMLEKEVSIIKKQIEIIETDVISAPDNDEIKKLFLIQKIVINFQTVVTGLMEMLRSFHTTNDNNLLWNDDYHDYYSDITIECNQLDKTISMINDTLKSLLDSAGSIQSNNLSRRMKTLTSLTIIISIPTLITGFYGMNIDLPFQNHPYSLLIVSLSSFLITLVVTVYLYKKDLF